MNRNFLYGSFLFLVFPFHQARYQETEHAKPAQEVLHRVIGEQHANRFELTINESGPGNYTIEADNGRINISGSSQIALCRGAYDYLSNACNSIVTWSGSRIAIPEPLPQYERQVTSPFRHHYYFNVVTHGYTTPYWDWSRWEKEIDWMALHGIDMPLVPGAHEAILYRVFRKIGLTDGEILEFFTGPAYLPLNRMGVIAGWDGPLPDSFFDRQLKLNHRIMERMRGLEMHPVIPAFAGFVPPGIQRLHPEEKLREMSWGGFDKRYQAHILEPGSALFVEIGKMYVAEWEKEFGKAEFYLADSFNEMDVPLSADPDTALVELSLYGESVYRSIRESNPDATWVFQGWTFPYYTKNGERFWTPERLKALVSKVPDEKLLILDLANEYNRLWWKIDPSWKIYDGLRPAG